MDWLTNEILFYGGIAVTVFSIIFALIYVIISHICRIHLDLQLDREYGEEEAMKNGAHAK